jgi:hypothetical protein
MMTVMLHMWRTCVWLMNPSVHVSIQHSAVSIVCPCARVPEAGISTVMRATGAGGSMGVRGGWWGWVTRALVRMSACMKDMCIFQCHALSMGPELHIDSYCTTHSVLIAAAGSQMQILHCYKQMITALPGPYMIEHESIEPMSS